jgi:hypothetical protein
MAKPQLQNLQYQKIHLNKELHVCLNYHGHEGIELVSEAEFEANTTEEQRKGPRGSHAYELARLTFEMKKREELVSSLKTHELRRKLYEGKLAMQRKFLDSLQVWSLLAYKSPKKYQKMMIFAIVRGIWTQFMLQRNQ